MSEVVLNPSQIRRLIGVRKAAELLRGRKTHASEDSVRRWMNRGVQIGGTIVKLKHVHLGIEKLTLPEWVEEFELERLQAATRAVQPRLTASPQRSARAAHRRAEKRLDKAGVK